MEEEDSVLVQRAQQGDKRAFDLLVTRHYSKVFGQALHIMKSREEAQDVAQLAWIKAWRKLPEFRGDSAFSSWIYRIVSFSALDAIRKRKSRRESVLEPEVLEFAAAEASTVAPPDQLRTLERQEIRERFDQALATLPEIQKDALTLREIDGLSYDEIASRMQCKIGTVMSRIFNARKAIQKSLADLAS